MRFILGKESLRFRTAALALFGATCKRLYRLMQNAIVVPYSVSGFDDFSRGFLERAIPIFGVTIR